MGEWVCEFQLGRSLSHTAGVCAYTIPAARRLQYRKNEQVRLQHWGSFYSSPSSPSKRVANTVRLSAGIFCIIVIVVIIIINYKAK
jgi:hypothetical protein